MPGWRVERTPRTASRSAMDTRGGSPLMPPHSQGAERRTERRAGRTGSRWVLRALVIGGLAGAAWLLTGAAAQAAGPDPEPVTGSFFGTVLDDVVPATGNEPMVGELLKAAVQPLESVPENHHRVLTLPADPDRVLSEPMQADDEALGEVLRTAPETLRTSSGDPDDQAQPEIEGDAAESMAEPAAPAPATPAAVPTRTITELPGHADSAGPARLGEVRSVRKASGSTRAGRAQAGVTPARNAKAHSRSHVHRHAPAARPDAPEALREDVPGGDGPAPARTNLGAVSGIPAGGSGGSSEGGSSAVIPSGTANGSVACHRCPVAPDVDARRNDAEAPTVSPD
jgi:hypothetical protein